MGYLWSAHFCYMAIQMKLGDHSNSNLILIGQDFRLVTSKTQISANINKKLSVKLHKISPLSYCSLPSKLFACDAAIQRTEIYEYLLSISQGNQCPHFQVYFLPYFLSMFKKMFI